MSNVSGTHSQLNFGKLHLLVTLLWLNTACQIHFETLKVIAGMAIIVML